MARNRKYQSAAIRFGPALKAFLLCLLIGGSGVGYVWQKGQIAQLGEQRKQRELRLTALAQHNKELRKQLGTLLSPRLLQRRIQDLGLGLVPPQETQVLRLSEPTDDSFLQGNEQQYASPRGSRTEPRG